ncbi:MAG: HD family phosphohydrolase [Microcoleaceae cyanobacterium]
MNTIQSITQQIERLWSRTALLQGALRRERGYSYVLKPSPPTEPSVQTSSSRKSLDFPQGFRSRKLGAPLLWILAVVSLTSVMGVRFYNQPKLAVGREAPETLYAPADATVLDPKTTEEKRKEALFGVVPVLVINSAVNQEVTNQIQVTLRRGNLIRSTANPFPFVDPGIFSTDVQNLLRWMPEWYWQEVLNSLKYDTTVQPQIQPHSTILGQISDQVDTELITPKTLQKALIQLQSYRQRSADEAFNAAIGQITEARKRYAKALVMIAQQSPTELESAYNQSLLEWSEATWTQTKIGIEQVSRQMLSQGIAPGLTDISLQQAIRIQVTALVPSPSQDFAIRFLSQVLPPNLIEDLAATRKRAELAAQEVQPVFVGIVQGEVIVQEGEKITQQEFVLLDYFNMSERGVNWRGLQNFVGLMSGATVIVLLVGKQVRPGLRRRDYFLLLLLTLSTPILVLLKVPSTNLPAVGLLAGSFYGSTLGVTVVTLLAVILPIGLEVDTISLLASAAGGILGSLLSGQLRSREELALLGGAVGLAQGVVYLIVTLILSSTAGSIWYVVLGSVVLRILEGLAWSVVALGISPYLEHLFDLITPIRLAELANPNRPLLKRLATEAPGTFQHTMFVATLAEAAAQTLGCNVELVRTGTLYHDIGKMHDPLGFIENQMGGPNKHDEINDPWKSAQIIKKHVSEGLVMARRCRLPQAIQAFIPEHQGKMLIAYFYYQAEQEAKADSQLVVQEQDFRYDGPIPQSRETGIVMLADSCEAALRSLKEATHEEALRMVNKILRARWQDHQLVDSGLTRENMVTIAEVFVRVWEQVNHKRIAYPKGVLYPR